MTREHVSLCQQGMLTANLQCSTRPEKIHSGESDFEPPRFKPDPSVYLLAAESEVRRITVISIQT